MRSAAQRFVQRVPDRVAQDVGSDAENALAALSARVAARSRQRRHRERLRAGKVVAPIVIGEAMLSFLLDAGYLHPNVADQTKAISKAVEAMHAAIQRTGHA